MRLPQSEQELLQIFLTSFLKLQNVERGSIWVKQKNQYVCIEAIGDQRRKIKGLKISVDQPSIVGWVIENKKMTISKPEDDGRHFAEIEKQMEVKSTVILCFPLIMKDNEVYGAIQLIDTTTKGGNINLRKEYLDLIENLINIGSIALSNFIDYNFQLNENLKLNETIHILRNEAPVIGKDKNFLDVLEKAREYAMVDFPVLLIGESGTGKEVIAREIYRLSARKNKPYVIQNCSAIPETLLESELFGHKKGAFTGAIQDKKGLFETADGGTVFLDEIGDMPVHLQARILRVIQNGEVKPVGGTKTTKVDIRIISATNVDLQKAIALGRFREDLFYRLNVLPIHLPPLRERREDIVLLIDYFLNRECHRLGIQPKSLSDEALAHLTQHPWTGNVRELENFVKQIIVMAKEKLIQLKDLPPHFVQSQTVLAAAAIPPHAQQQSSSHAINPGLMPQNGRPSDAPDEHRFDGYTWARLEEAYVYYLLNKTRWNISKASKVAGLNRSTFNSRMRKLGIRKDVDA